MEKVLLVYLPKKTFCLFKIQKKKIIDDSSSTYLSEKNLVLPFFSI